ncbi:MAG: 50S ribosomal protein L25/general stress protein Ctc [Actinomycetota bacterium]
MTEVTTIAATLRDRAGKGAARATRRAGGVPAVIYGGKQAPVCITLEPKILWAEMQKPGFTTKLFDVDLGKDGKHRCLARDVQMHPVTDKPVHVDFMRVSADARLHVAIPVHFVNQDKAPGIKRGGVLNVEHHTIEVTCSPDNIPHEIVVDLAGKEIGAAVHVSDLALPAGVKAYHLEGGETVATIAPPTVAKAAEEATETPAAG